MRGGAGDEQRVLVLPDAARRGAVVRPVVRAALHAALGLPAAALPAPRAPVAAVPQLLLTTNDYRLPTCLLYTYNRVYSLDATVFCIFIDDVNMKLLLLYKNNNIRMLQMKIPLLCSPVLKISSNSRGSRLDLW